MGYERVYGPERPCGCGKGVAHPYRIEHATHLSRHPDRYGAGVEIDCEVCDPTCETYEIDDRQWKLKRREAKKAGEPPK
jgi:hypothetical protein